MTITEKLNSKGLINLFNGIISCADKGKVSSEEAEALKRLTDHKGIIAGNTIGNYATGVLHILGIEDYKGTDENIIRFITGYSRP